MTINGGNGNDTIAAGVGDFDNSINGEVSILGGAGDDLLRIDDSADTLADSYTLTAGAFTKSSEPTGSVLFRPAGLFAVPDIDRIELTANNASNNIYLNGLGGSMVNPFPQPPTVVAVNVTISGGDGNDNLYIADSAKLLTGLRGDITVTGNAGNDRLYIDDANASTNDTHTMLGANYSKSSWSHTILFSAEELVLQAGAGSDDINATNVNAAMTLLGGAGADEFRIEGNFAGISTVVDGEAGLDDVTVNLDGVGNTIVQFNQSQDLDLLNMGTGAVVSLAPNHLLLDVVGTSIGGRLDLR